MKEGQLSLVVALSQVVSHQSRQVRLNAEPSRTPVPRSFHSVAVETAQSVQESISSLTFSRCLANRSPHSGAYLARRSLALRSLLTVHQARRSPWIRDHFSSPSLVIATTRRASALPANVECIHQERREGHAIPSRLSDVQKKTQGELVSGAYCHSVRWTAGS